MTVSLTPGHVGLIIIMLTRRT